jgi:chorismate synthase
MRVAAGAIARKILSDDITIRGALVQMGPHKIDRARWDWDACAQNPFWCPDAKVAKEWETYLDEIRKSGSSAGAVVEVVASGVPAGLGAPLFDKLDGEIGKALMNIPAAKGVEIGAGFDAAAFSGEENADEMRMEDGKVKFLSNNAGGMLGGISTGQDIIARLAIKPTSSILSPRKTVTVDGKDTEIVTKGRHDPCVGIRGVPVVEAMLACVLADHWLRHKAQCG